MQQSDFTTSDSAFPPPHSLAAELELVAGVLFAPEDRSADLPALRPDDFVGPRARDVWRAVLAVVADGNGVNPTQVAEWLAREASSRPIDGLDWSGTLLQLYRDASPGASAFVKHNARVVRSAALVRSSIGRMARFQREVGSLVPGMGDELEMFSALGADFLGLAEEAGDHKSKPASLGDVLAEVIDDLNNEREIGPKTGLLDLDRLIDGGLEGLVILAARTSVGKTLVALQIALNMAARGDPVLFVTGEMRRSELVVRALSNIGRVDGQRIRARTLGQSERTRVLTAADEMQHQKLYLSEPIGHFSVERVRAEAAKMKREIGLKAVFVDYLQLMDAPYGRRDAKRYEALGEVSRGLKVLSGTLGVPVIACAQLGREADKMDRPQLGHLRESGNIEQDADSVILLWEEADDRQANVIRAVVAKNRHGRVGPFTLHAERQFYSVANRAPEVLATMEFSR